MEDPTSESAPAPLDGGPVASSQSNARLTPAQRALAALDRWHGDVRVNLGRELSTEQMNQLTAHVETLKTAVTAALA